MKRLVFGVAVCMALLAVALSAWSATKGQYLQRPTWSAIAEPRAPDTSGIAQPVITIVAVSSEANIEDVVRYPNGKQVHHWRDENDPEDYVYDFTTPDSLDVILSYYKRTLASAGWLLQEEVGRENIRGLYFVWLNPSTAPTAAPGRRYLHVSITGAVGEEEGFIRINHERWPDPNGVQLLPDAQDVTVEWEQPPNDPDWERVTTFTTSATPDEVEAFYREILPKHGWVLTNWQPPEGTNFGYNRGGPETGTGSSVIVDARLLADGKTGVELRARGDEINDARP
jgi:hypothetical protein